MKSSRLYLDIAVSFLTNRESTRDVGDWEKLRRVKRFVQCTLKVKSNFGATNPNEIFIWVNEFYVIHHATMIQTRVTMSMGLGVTNCITSKKKLNTQSSTESELVGASDYVPFNILSIIFMHHQGYLNKPNNFSKTIKAP